MSAGAFSDAKVVEAAKLIVPILVDCSDKGSQEELQKKYSIEGYPTVLYADPDGKKTGEMGSRDAGPVAKEIQNTAKKFPGRPSMWENSVAGALEGAKKAKKPLAIYMAEENADLLKLAMKLQKDLGDRKGKFVWIMQRGLSHGLEAAPGVVVLDPNAMEEPLDRIPVKADDKPDVLNKALDEALKKVKK